jgi:MFS transporter, PAT family, beta-lactamase induction signal transducer AmpG
VLATRMQRSLMSRRTVLFALLYASEGAPIGFIWWALPTLLRSAGVPVESITALTAVLVLPWVLKFLWAPLVDLLRGRRWGYRAWIVLMQTTMGASLVPLIWIDPVSELGTWRALLLVHAVAAATQDVAIDALAIGVVPAAERGRLNGAMQAGMLTGRSLFGGGAVAIAAGLGRPWLIGALVVWILTAMGALGLLRDAAPAPPLAEEGRRWLRAMRATFRHRATWFGLAFALTSGAAFEATGQLAGPFLVDRGASNSTIGAFLGIFVVGAMLAGGLAGGVASDRWGRTRVVALSLAGFVTMILLVAWTDRAGFGASVTRLALLTGMYVFVGIFTAASYALFMDLTDPEIGATQFTTFMAATNGCESWAGWSGGRLVAAQGYPAAFAVMSVVSVLSLPLLVWIRRDAGILRARSEAG